MSDTTSILQTASTLLAPYAKETKTPEPNRHDVIIGRQDLLAAVKTLAEARFGFLSAITGLDLTPVPAPKKEGEPAASGELEVLYHFCQGAAVVTLRVRVPRAGAELPSVCGLVPYVSLFERELSEMFGITITNAEYPEHLFLSEDWPAGVYPLRKDAQIPMPGPAAEKTTAE